MLTDAHSRLSSTSALLAARRDIYRMVSGVLGSPGGDGPDTDATPDVADSPVFRHAVRSALARGTRIGPAEIAAAVAAADVCTRVDVDGVSVPVVSAAGADDVLRDVHDALGTAHVGFVTGTDTGSDGVLDDVRPAVVGAVRAYPAFGTDLLPHVGMIAALRPPGADDVHVRSASLREFPGLVVVSTPAPVWEIAEMLVHEAAHARYYDMVTVHDILPPDPEKLGSFTPSWRAPGTRWPVEQAFAAFHAYVALAELWAQIEADGVELSGDSLLPQARARADELGAWLRERASGLGADAASLLDGLLGVAPRPVRTPEAGDAPVLPENVTVPSEVRVRFEEGASVAIASRPGPPTEVFLLGRESGRVLRSLLGRGAVEAAVHELSSGESVPRGEARKRVHTILRGLTERDLVRLPVEQASPDGRHPDPARVSGSQDWYLSAASAPVRSGPQPRSVEDDDGATA